MKRILAIAVALAALALASCERPAGDAPTQAAPQQTFTVQGWLRGINFAEGSVTVEHEDIPDYMPAMTMPFDVKTLAEVERLKAGDAIEFKMVVTANNSWIEGVKKIDAREVQLPQKKEVGAMEGNVPRLKDGDPLPPFQFVDSKGRPVTRETFLGKPLLLTFIFTRCPVPNFCPLITKQFREVQQSLAGVAGGSAAVQLLSVSIDPGFDTPAVLAAYAAQYTSDTDGWRFASGTEAETQRLAQAFSLSIQPESGTIAHGLATALIGPDGAVRQIWRGNGWKAAEVVEAARAVGVTAKH